MKQRTDRSALIPFHLGFPEISRLQQIHLIIDEVSTIAKTLSSSYEPSLDAFLEPFDRLLFEFADEYKEHSLDEVVVGAIAPAVSRRFFSDPSLLIFLTSRMC